jgi:hypothetical protein
MEPFTRALLDRAKSLVGAVLRGVDYDVALSEALDRSRSDSMTVKRSIIGVNLLFDHEMVSVRSSDEFTDGTFELSLHGGPVPERQDGVGATPSSDDAPWSEVVGQTIVSSKIHWVDSPFVAITKRRKAFSSHHFDVDGAVPFSGPQAPLALELHFTNAGRVLLVSGDWKGIDQPIVETGSGISVLWDTDTFATLVPRIARELKKSW